MSPRDAVRVAMTKWGDRPHWEYDAVYLGSDEHGEWLGCPVGTHYRRPGRQFVATFASVVLIPAGRAAHLAGFNTAEARIGAVYVDITTPPEWDGAVLRAVDVDLDVVRRHDGSVYLDDEDEFAEHRVSLGYPAEVCDLAVASCDRVRALVEAGSAPYDGTAAGWLARI